MAHCTEARRVRRELDRQLAEAGAASGRSLSWTAQDKQVLALLASAIDRKNDLQADYASAADEPKTRIKLAAELRLCESHIERLLRRISTQVPQPMSRRSQKAQAAAFARWSRDAG